MGAAEEKHIPCRNLFVHLGLAILRDLPTLAFCRKTNEEFHLNRRTDLRRIFEAGMNQAARIVNSGRNYIRTL
jgi:hypothetical protein